MQGIFVAFVILATSTIKTYGLGMDARAERCAFTGALRTFLPTLWNLFSCFDVFGLFFDVRIRLACKQSFILGLRFKHTNAVYKKSETQNQCSDLFDYNCSLTHHPIDNDACSGLLFELRFRLASNNLCS